MKKLSLLILLATGLVFFSCTALGTGSGTSTENMEALNNLQKAKWFLDDAEGFSQSAGGQPISLGFSNEDGELKVNGFAGCNKFFGGVDADNKNIAFKQLGATLMACPDMDKEDAFMKLLPQVNNYQISGNTLTLYRDKIALMKFVKAQR